MICLFLCHILVQKHELWPHSSRVLYFTRHCPSLSTHGNTVNVTFFFSSFLKNNFCFIYIKQQFPVFQSVILILCLQDDNYRKIHFPRFLNEKPATFIYFLGIGPLLFLNSTWLEMHSMVSASKQLPATCVLFGSQVFYRINNGPHSFIGNTFKEMVTP